MAKRNQSQISLSICRIRKLLSGDRGVLLGKATSGSGCIVNLNSGGEASSPSRAPKRSPFLITTTQVINKNDLISPNTSIIVEVLDGGNLLAFNLGFKCASDFPDPIPGRVLGGTGDALKEVVSFIVIPVEKFDNRNVVTRKFSSWLPWGTSFEKRVLICNYQSDENIQFAISRRKLLCHVIRDGRSDASYNAEPYCLEFGKDTSEFALTSPLDHDGADDVKHLKDFHKEEKPRGAPLLDAEGKLVGMLAIAPSDERKLFPLLLPTQDGGSTSCILSKDDWNTQVGDCEAVTSNITVQLPETSTEVTSGSDQAAAAAANERSHEEERNKAVTNNNQNLSHQDEHAANNYITLEVQRSGNSPENPLQLDDSSPVVPNELFPERKAIAPPPPPVIPPAGEQEIEQVPDSDSSQEQEDEEHLDEEVDSVSGLNENVHESQSTDGPIRPGLLTQHSCYDSIPPFVPADDQDEDGDAYGVKETASPKSSYEPRSHNNISSWKSHPKTQNNTSAAELEHFSPDSLVKDKIVSKIKVMDMLSLHLDRSLYPGCRDAPQTQRWEHLADEFKVPDERKRKCENFTGMLSPSENMFHYLCATHDSLTVKRIKDNLREIGRKDVVDELEKNSRLDDDATVADLCENHPETLNVMCLKLDDKRGPVNWHDLGLKLGIAGGTLWTFKDPEGDSPSKVILKKLETSSPYLRIMTIEEALEELNLSAIAKLLNDLKDGSTIETLLDNPDVLDKVTAMLDKRESSWYRFGQAFEIDRIYLDSLKPDPISSPTKVVMECIVQEYPNLNMKTFLETLAKIKRNDVIKELKTFFHPNDIDDIVPPESLRNSGSFASTR